MKEKIRESLSSTEGITLVALVVTIIVLLILAGVSLNTVFSQQGIFNRAENAVDKHSQSKARETLDLVFSEAQMKKYDEGLSEEELDKKIEEVGELLPKDDPDSSNQLVIVEGYIFEIDRSVPKVVEYKGPADGIIITAIISGNNGWVKPGESVTVKGTIKTYSGGTITNVSATKKDGTIISGFTITEESYEINNITEDTEITITAEDSKGKTNSKIVKVVIKRDITPPTIETFDIIAEGLKIIINVTAEDSESGLKHFNYSISPETGLTNTTGTFVQGQPLELNSTNGQEYTVTITAEDNVGNKSKSQKKKIEVCGVLKHIKTPTGLKEVNTVDVYGADVTGYSCSKTGVEWQLFYIDEEDDHRVYLISKNYMGPPTTGTEMTCYKSLTYYWESSVLEKYNTSIPNTSFTQKFLSEFAGKSATNNGLQKTNYLLNQTVWSEYKNSKSDFAFGAPTLALWVSSRNDISLPSKRASLQLVNDKYELKNGNETNSHPYAYSIGDENTQKGIYSKAPGKNTVGYYIASPIDTYSTYGSNKGAGCSTTQGYAEPKGCFGIRPIVCLKSNTLFTCNEDGTYSIN